MIAPTQILVAALEHGGFDPRPSGPDSWESRCPAHDGDRRNLAVKAGDDGRVLLHCHAHDCAPEAVVQALGLAMSDLFPPRDGTAPRPDARPASNGKAPPRPSPTPEAAIGATARKLGTPTASWTYRDADGHEVMRVYRFDPPEGRKEYRPVHAAPDGWALGDPPGPLPLYHRGELAGDGRVYVYVTEGEKCADLARGLGVMATTSAHGAGAARKSDWRPLAGREVVLLPDRDDAGERYTREVLAALAGLEPAPVVRVVRLPGLPDGGDIEVWLRDVVPDTWEPEQCRAELERLAGAAPVEDLRAAVSDRAAVEAGDELPIKARSWPAPPEEAAYAGLAGEIVRAIEPHTESDPVAILVQLLLGFGNLIGRSAHFAVEADRHFANEFAALVGDTAKGRKGTSWGHARRSLEAVDPAWAAGRMLGGLSTGEGLIHAVRDAATKREPIRDGKRIVGYQDVETDSGEPDKRLLAIEPELGGTLRVATREGNSLSALIRQAWDTGDLRTLTRNNPLRATGAHVSIIGHITRDELARLLTRTEAGNGFANRFLWIAVRRSKALPFGGTIGAVDFDPMAGRLREAADFARTVGLVGRDREADRLWAEAYERLSDGRPGLLGAVISRAEAHAMRLALLYALLDRSAVIRAGHLQSALALWDYAERSAVYIFGDALGDPDADALLDALRSDPAGMTRTDIRDRVFGRHKSSERIARLLALLSEAGLAHPRTEATGGRPAERWFSGRGGRHSAVSAVRAWNETTVIIRRCGS